MGNLAEGESNAKEIAGLNHSRMRFMTLFPHETPKELRPGQQIYVVVEAHVNAMYDDGSAYLLIKGLAPQSAVPQKGEKK